MESSSLAPHRRTLLLVCLVTAVGVVGVLGYEAVAAARAQRTAVEGVIRDYAELAAEQYARNVRVTMDYEWVFPLFRLLEAAGDEAPPTDPDLLVAGQRGEYRLADLATGFFTVDANGAVAARRIGRSGGGHAEGEPDEPSPERETQTASEPPTRSMQQDHILPDTLREVLVAGLLANDADNTPPYLFISGDDASLLVVARPAGGRIQGFSADRRILHAKLSEAVGVYELLPPTLTADAGADELVRVRVTSASGHDLFANGPEGDLALGADLQLPEYQGRLRIAASIPAQSAARLVPGGLPYSRLPLIAVLLLVTLALFGFGAFLYRREQELVDLREQFVAGASHELRTPLAQIRMFAETLRLQRVRSEQERDRSLTIIDREARRLSLLVDNLLQFSRSSQATDPSRGFTPEPLDLAALAGDVVEGFAPLAAARDAHIDLRVSSAPTVAGDRDLLRQVLVNLLDNAVKYGPDGQTVVLSIAGSVESSRRARIEVADQGPGVPARERPLVWQRFWRGERVNGITGTGIGLALVRELVELHGGSVSIDDAPGGGARFVVELPEEAQ